MFFLVEGALRSISLNRITLFCLLSLAGEKERGGEGPGQALCKVSPGFGVWFMPGEGHLCLWVREEECLPVSGSCESWHVWDGVSV